MGLESCNIRSQEPHVAREPRFADPWSRYSVSCRGGGGGWSNANVRHIITFMFSSKAQPQSFDHSKNKDIYPHQKYVAKQVLQNFRFF